MISVRHFTDSDASELAELMLEMLAYYNTPLAVEGPLGEDIIRQSKNVNLAVAVSDDRIAGFATYGFLYPVRGLETCAYIQQIYVGSRYRRLGAAQKTMAFIAQDCLNRGCDWLEWSTGRENLRAQSLYDGLGATASTKVTYEITGEALRKLASLSG